MPYDTVATMEFFNSGQTISLRSEPVARLYVAHDGYPNGRKGVLEQIGILKAKLDMFGKVFGPVPLSADLLARMVANGLAGRVMLENGSIDDDSRFLYRIVVTGEAWVVSVYTPTFRADGRLEQLEFMFSITI